MERGGSFIELKLGVDEPIEVSEFVAAFTAVAAEYSRFSKGRGDQDNEATLFVSEVKQGSIIAQLIPMLPLLTGTIEGMSAIITAEDFVKRYGERLAAYLTPGGRVPDATKTELKDFSEQVAAIATHPNSNLEMAAIEIKDGQRKVKAAFKFNTSEAREIQERVAEHRRELDHISTNDHERMHDSYVHYKWLCGMSAHASVSSLNRYMTEDRRGHEFDFSGEGIPKTLLMGCHALIEAFSRYSHTSKVCHDPATMKATAAEVFEMLERVQGPDPLKA